jgi:hypothetical protein
MDDEMNTTIGRVTQINIHIFQYPTQHPLPYRKYFILKIPVKFIADICQIQ